MSNIIKLQPSNGEIIDVDVEVAKCIGTIKTMLHDCGIDDDINSVVPLPNISSSILRRVLEWISHHKDAAAQKDDGKVDKRSNEISAWGINFLRIPQSTLFELITAANYLDVKDLLYAASKTVANMLKDKLPDQIRATFQIENDFTQEDQDLMRQEIEWCEDQ